MPRADRARTVNLRVAQRIEEPKRSCHARLHYRLFRFCHKVVDLVLHGATGRHPDAPRLSQLGRAQLLLFFGSSAAASVFPRQPSVRLLFLNS